MPIDEYQTILNDDQDWRKHVSQDGIQASPYTVYNIPQINFQLWNSDKRHIQMERINGLADYILSPCIVDDFTDQDARKFWRLGLEGRYPWFHDFLENNVFYRDTEVIVGLSEGLMEGYNGRDKQHVINANYYLRQASERFGHSITPDVRNAQRIQMLALNVLEIISGAIVNPIHL